MRPPWPFRLGGGSPDGLTRRRGAGVWRLLMAPGDAPVLVAVVQPARDRVLFAARAETEAAARHGIARMRFATAVDEDLRGFHERFRDDPVIGPTVRASPHLRVTRHPDPWIALAWAITEQKIEFSRAVEIQRRMIARLGHRCPRTGLRVAPTPEDVLGVAPARLEGWDLAAGRGRALRHAAREVARGRIDLEADDHETGWRRLRAIPGVGAWTVEILAALRPGPPRPGARRRPRLPEDRRPPDHGQPPGARRRGRGARVLRPLRRVEGARGALPPRGRRRRAAAAPAHDEPGESDTAGSRPSPGRNSLVCGAGPAGRCVSSPFVRIHAS